MSGFDSDDFLKELQEDEESKSKEADVGRAPPINNAAVRLISPYEQIFSLLGVKIGAKGSNDILDPCEFRRIGGVEVKKAWIRIDKGDSLSRLHLQLPEDTNTDLESFFEEQASGSEVLIVDNAFSITKYIECLTRNNELGLLNIKYSSKQPVFFDPAKNEGGLMEEEIGAREHDSPLRGAAKKIPEYIKGGIPNMMPMNFVWGCGYRSMCVWIAIQKCNYNDKEKKMVYNTEESLERKDFDNFYLTMKYRAYLKLKEFFTNSCAQIPDYRYASFYDIEHKNRKNGDFIDKLTAYSKIAGYGVSTWYHEYADLLTRAVYDTYNTFNMTHSNIGSAANSLHGFKIVVGSVFMSQPFEIKTLADNDLCFPSEKRMLHYNSKVNAFFRPMLKTIKADNDALKNRYLDEFDDYVKKFEKSRNPYKETLDEISNKDLGFNKIKISKMMNNIIGLYEVDEEFDLDDSDDAYHNDRAQFVNFLEGFRGFATIFLVDSSKLMTDTKTHAMNVSGMFDNVKNGKTRNDLIALPGFFLQYLYEEGYIKSVHVKAACVFSKKTRLNVRGGPGNMARKGFRYIKSLTDFACSPFVALYERMYSVYYVNCIYKEWLSRLPANTVLNLVYNHSAKEGVIFTSKDTFSNTGKNIVRAIGEDGNKEGNLQWEHYFFMEVKDTNGAELELFKDGDIESGKITEVRAGELINNLQNAIDLALANEVKTFVFPFNDEPVEQKY